MRVATPTPTIFHRPALVLHPSMPTAPHRPLRSWAQSAQDCTVAVHTTLLGGTGVMRPQPVPVDPTAE